MDEATQRRCLEPFFTTKGERGSGLGLAMVYGMITRHSAELQLESTPGDGSTFRLIFAGRAPACAAERSRQPSVRTAPVAHLLVDDDPAAHRLAAGGAVERWP